MKKLVRADRLKHIQELLFTRGEVSLQELQSRFPEKSLMTIRRDLDYLETQGVLIRTHGGAVSVREIASRNNDDFRIREIKDIASKNAIAVKAATLVEPGMTLYLDAGSTSMCLARHLPDAAYTIITHAPNLALSLMEYNHPTVIMVGGVMMRSTLSAAGNSTLSQLDQAYIDLAFLGASGFLPQAGFTNSNPFECEVKRKIIERSRRTVMLLDSTKIGRQAAFAFAKTGEIGLFITDRALPVDVKAEFIAQKVEVWDI
ncbi:MAG: DeoR/GlpR family DNA-binding transcription regulator [Bacillota bacterium]